MKKKLNVSIVLLMLLAIVVTMIFMAVAFNNLYTKQVMKDLKLFASFVHENNMTENMVDVKDEYDEKELRVTVLDDSGNVLSDNAADVQNMDNHSDRPEVVAAMRQGEGEAVRRSDTLDKSTYYYAVKMENGNVLRVSREADSIYKYLQAIVPSLLIIMLILFAASLFITNLLTKNLLKPIEKLAENIEGNYAMEVYEELQPFILRIREQHADLLASAKIRQEFTANVTHELKTPLTSISGYAELIETGLASGDDIVRFAKGIHTNANRLLTLINEIIRLSELDSDGSNFPMENLNIYRVAKDCVEMLAPNAKKHQVSIRLQGQDSVIYANKMMMEELLYNLCDNAIRYNNENGSVFVDVHEEGSQVILTVSDTGIGISKEHQDRIFERFYRVDKSRSKSTGGTGLGLAIVKHILEKHDAKLELESEPGRGTKMKICLKKSL